MSQFLRALCWSCGKTFHVRLAEESGAKDSGTVVKLVSCSHCQTLCELTIDASQAAVEERYRNSNLSSRRTSGNSLSAAQPLPTQKPSS